MPRRRPETRLDDLLDAATAVFSESGFRRTQMADVARRLGVSAGTLYGYVESKEALFDLALRRAFGETIDGSALPVPAPDAAALVEHVRAGMRRRLRTPGLVEAASRPPPADVGAELAALLVELHDVLAANAPAIRLLERSLPDRPDLAALYFGRRARRSRRTLAPLPRAPDRRGTAPRRAGRRDRRAARARDGRLVRLAPARRSGAPAHGPHARARDRRRGALARAPARRPP